MASKIVVFTQQNNGDSCMSRSERRKSKQNAKILFHQKRKI
jgi:hypothetical protein